MLLSSGMKEEAIKSFEKAVKLFEQSPNLSQNLHYLDALAWLGIAYMKNGETDKAKAQFQKALEQEPNFVWVKDSLMPMVEN